MSKVLKCRCDSKPCGGGCPCFKAGTVCHAACHMGTPWVNVPCLNTEHGLKVKEMKAGDIRKALCDAGLSPVGDSSELKKRLAVHFSTLTSSASSGGGGEDGAEKPKGGCGGGGSDSTEELMNAIMENEGDYVFILSLSGKMVKETSSKAELRRAYLGLSTKVHPDKNPGSLVSKKAFQAVLESFERLANPEKFEDEDDDEDDGKPKKKRQKKERFTRDNAGCFMTLIKCPRCKDRWNTKDLGLEDSAYNFLMQGVKQYICGGCFAKFGCMTAYHFCPHCKKAFEYDPDDYHRKISCGNPKCTKTFGFMMFKVSERREVEIRREVKAENEEVAKKRAQQKRRAARMDKRVGTQTNEERVQEQLFLLKLIDNCPRCGWELERGMRMEDAKGHLEGCNDKEAIKAHQKAEAKKKAKAEKKDKLEESQEDVMAFKTWEYNGRQVGQLWMLSEVTLKKECKKFSLSTEGHKHELIARLGKVIRSRERKMLTMGGEASKGSHDITPINKVDDEDLPQNMESMEREELQCVAASYGLDFDHSKDVKMDLVKKLTSARLKGTGLLMITDEGKEEEEVDDSDDDPEFKVGGNDSDSDY